MAGGDDQDEPPPPTGAGVWPPHDLERGSLGAAEEAAAAGSAGGPTREDEPDALGCTTEAAAAQRKPAATQRKAAAQPSSRYVGVRWDQHRGRRWRAEIWHEGRTQRLGSFAEEEEEAAARAFDDAARRLRGEKAHGGRNQAGNVVWRLNFPTEAEAAVPNGPDDAPEPVDDEQVAAAEAVVAQRRAAGQPTSSFAGVSWPKKGRRWRAEIWHEGRKQRLGSFAEEEAAARAFDDAARRLRGDEAHGGGRTSEWRLNFPTEAEAAAAAQGV